MWPCGQFIKNFKELPGDWPKSSWAWYGDSSHSVNRSSPGQAMKRICMGCITCSNPTCNFLCRPQVRQKGKGISRQLEQKCQNPLCRSLLIWEKCDVIALWTTFKALNGDGYIGIWKHQGI
jgi:hypothetical protein